MIWRLDEANPKAKDIRKGDYIVHANGAIQKVVEVQVHIELENRDHIEAVQQHA